MSQRLPRRYINFLDMAMVECSWWARAQVPTGETDHKSRNLYAMVAYCVAAAIYTTGLHRAALQNEYYFLEGKTLHMLIDWQWQLSHFAQDSVDVQRLNVSPRLHNVPMGRTLTSTQLLRTQKAG